MELNFNKIYVIESLPDNETKTGTNLHNDIIRRKIWGKEDYYSELEIINSKNDFFSLFEQIKTEIKEQNIIPFLHFEIHGNPSGLYLKSNEQVNWIELHSKLMEINELTNIKVWISLATCYGAYIYSIIKPTDKAPFYGYVGAWEELNIEDLSVSFERFFDDLLNDFDVVKALKALNLENPNLPVEYKVYNVVDVFKKTYRRYEETQYEEENFKKRVKIIVQAGLNDPKNIKQKLSADFFRYYAEKVLIEDKEYYRKKYENHFFMVDVFPENKKRFKL